MSTISTYTGDGSTTQFDVTFSYSAASTVKASVDGVETVAFSFINASRIQFTNAPIAGSEIKIFRRTETTPPAVEFSDSAILTSGDLNRAVAQPRDRVEELVSEVDNVSGRSVRVPLGETAVSLPAIASRIGRYMAFDAVGNPIGSEGTGSDAALRADVAAAEGGDLVGTTQDYDAAIVRTVRSKLNEFVSVLDFGADPTGVTDSTAAFNAATQAVAEYGSGLVYNVFVPPGTYKLDGTVYVRKGQTLFGVGHGTQFDLGAATGVSFKLGWSSTGVDPGGNPAGIENIWTVGGNASSAVIDVESVAGFSLRHLFMTFPGTGINLNGSADGIISDIEIDQSLSALAFVGSQNIAASNIQLYLPNYGLTLGAQTRDVTFSNLVIVYPRYAGILFATGATEIRGVSFHGGLMSMNEQFTTYEALIHIRASDADFHFNGTQFRNWKSYAVLHELGGTVMGTFSDCIFDGARSATAYAQSTTAAVLAAGPNGTFRFNGSEFRNLLGLIAQVNHASAKLSLTGGSVVNCPISRIETTVSDKLTITVSNVEGFAYQSSDATHQFIVLPWWGRSARWRISISGNTAAGAAIFYGAAEELIAAVDYQYDGSAAYVYADKVSIWKTPTRTIPGDLAAVVEFGQTPGGGSTIAAPGPDSGFICVSVPVALAAAADFHFKADLIA